MGGAVVVAGKGLAIRLLLRLDSGSREELRCFFKESSGWRVFW
jgi:hypothetical protein